MAKFKTDGFRIAKDMLARGIFSDVKVYKDRGGIQIIAVKEGLIHMYLVKGYKRFDAFNKFKDQLDVETFIDEFIAQM